MVPEITNISEWTSFIDSSTVLKGNPLLLLLEHLPLLDDASLRSLFPWNDTEKTRISQFRSQSAKTSWCISRVFAYEVLSKLLGIKSREISLSLGKYGKPYLSGNHVFFNWSHSNGCCALALSTEVDIGCDIEDITRPISDIDEIMYSYFRKEEITWITKADGEDKKRRFFTVFCQKEAWLKEKGFGLSKPLTAVSTVQCEIPFHRCGMTCVSSGNGDRFIVALSNTGKKGSTPVIHYHQCKTTY